MFLATDVAAVKQRTKISPSSYERDWLEFLAEFFAEPPAKLPYERIARLLCRTFRSAACSYSRILDGQVVDGMIWAFEDAASVAQTQSPTHPEGTPDADVALRARNEAGPPLGYSYRLSLPAPLSPIVKLAFVLGRDDPYGPSDRRLAAILWTLLAALDLRIQTSAAEPRPADQVALTRRELAVLELLSTGKTAAAIAHRLCISTRTVHKHLERIYAKLDVTDRLGAVFAARRLGLLG